MLAFPSFGGCLKLFSSDINNLKFLLQRYGLLYNCIILTAPNSCDISVKAANCLVFVRFCSKDIARHLWNCLSFPLFVHLFFFAFLPFNNTVLKEKSHKEWKKQRNRACEWGFKNEEKLFFFVLVVRVFGGCVKAMIL